MINSLGEIFFLRDVGWLMLWGHQVG